VIWRWIENKQEEKLPYHRSIDPSLPFLPYEQSVGGRTGKRGWERIEVALRKKEQPELSIH
jgi:hypothetical protein